MMTPLDTGLTIASGLTAGAASAASTVGVANLSFTVLSAAVGAGVAYGVLKKGAEARDKEVAEVKAKLDALVEGQSDIRERLAKLEGKLDV